MSRTYHTTHEFYHKIEEENKKQKALAKAYGLHNPFDEVKMIDTNDPKQKCLLEDSRNYDGFIRGMNSNINQYDFSRHPKGTKGTGLGKGLRYGTRYWRNRFDEENSKSSRLHLWKKLGTKIRRTEEQRNMQKQINNIEE